MKRVGIMGGSFDPIHIGHLILADTALEQFSLDKILFIPSGNPPHKLNRDGRASVSDRMEITRLAIEGNPGFELSDIEARSEGVYTYTYLTLEALRGMNPDTEYYFIIGGDSLRDFPTWRCPEKISKMCVLIAAVRDRVTGDVFDK
ncbi:MAG: nicotinate (nicotinamide) nucleotide adenylyltransferase, partial [Lachnospiraceae bacterium]|nr:nicotinate (nicotinamide) nucleotide adenylyltransferase [Lachnospiraceae bacterium]